MISFQSLVISALIIWIGWGWLRLARIRLNRVRVDEIVSLENDLALLLGKAREELSSDDLVGLTAELKEIQNIEMRMRLRGAGHAEARRVTLKGARRSVANYLNLSRILPE